MNKKPSSKLQDDSMFSIKISESMEIRNTLRSGLFEAQGKGSSKIPLFVSWPSWLEDGIVCIYAKDLHALLTNTVRDTASSFSRLIDQPGEDSFDEVFTGEPEEPDIDKAREAARAILEQPLGRQRSNLQQELADSLFKKYKEGGGQAEPV